MTINAVEGIVARVLGIPAPVKGLVSVPRSSLQRALAGTAIGDVARLRGAAEQLEAVSAEGAAIIADHVMRLEQAYANDMEQAQEWAQRIVEALDGQRSARTRVGPLRRR